MRRVNELLRRELGGLISQRISNEYNALVTISSIRTSPDLRQASVFVSIYPYVQQFQTLDKLKQRVMDKLRKERIAIQQRIAHNVRLKYIPVLEFRVDTMYERADRLLRIIDQLQVDE